MKRNRYLLPLGALLAVVALGAVVMLVRASADDLLHQAARLMANAENGHAKFSVVVETPEETTSGTFEVWGQRNYGPEGETAFHIKVLDASKAEALGAEAVSDGSQVWIYSLHKNMVYVGTHEELKAKMAEHRENYDPGAFDGHAFDRPELNEEDIPETPEEAVDKLLTYFTAERAGGAMVAGEDGVQIPAEKLRLIPIPEQMPEELRANGGLLNILLRKADNAPLSAEYTNGAVGYARATATLLELNVVVDPTHFTFEIPAGAEIVNLADLEPPASLTREEAAQAAGFAVLEPAELPAAARLEGINEVRGAVVQRYRLPDGERFTIAQGPADAADAPGDNGEAVTVRGVDGLLFSDDGGQRTLLTWLEGSETIWVGGDLTPDEALAIAESLR